MRKHGVFFVQGVRPTGSRGFGCDRCRGQEEGAAKGEETGSVLTDQREGEQTTMFRGGTSQVQIPAPRRETGTLEAALRSKVLDPLRNSTKKDTFSGVFFCCVKMSHAEAGKLGARGSFQIPAPQKEMGTPKAALRSKVLDPLRNSTKNTIHEKQLPLKKTLIFFLDFLRGIATAVFRRKQSVAF